MKSISKVIIVIISMSFLFSQYMSSIKTAKMHELNKNWDSAISIYIDIINKQYLSKQNIPNPTKPNGEVNMTTENDYGICLYN